MSNTSPKPDSNPRKDDNHAPGVGAIIGSTLAAAFGVQSRRNQERDFTKGNIWRYIVAGILFTIGFVAAVAFGVSLVV